MDTIKSVRECNKHEKRVTDQDFFRICEICTSHFFMCELCRAAKGIDVPKTVCKNVK